MERQVHLDCLHQILELENGCRPEIYLFGSEHPAGELSLILKTPQGYGGGAVYGRVKDCFSGVALEDGEEFICLGYNSCIGDNCRRVNLHLA
ncbi:MAG: hypothetical protein JW727_05875 [Candidatus Aenigmarchaeota archaeon]|nr:hypothetical protein [Candidatus Aenigmarchaeota archaeon]